MGAPTHRGIQSQSLFSLIGKHETIGGIDMDKRIQGGLGYLALAAVVFIICSLIQGAGGSSMFETTYYTPDSWVLDLAMQVTFWPGWILTAVLLFRAVVVFLGGAEDDEKEGEQQTS